MLSIFIWKSDKEEENKDTTFSMVKYDRGADWFSDPTGSYELIAIEHVTDTEGRPVLCYRARIVSYDKVGSDLLERLEIPFRCRKMSDGNGNENGEARERWDSVGRWERCIVMDTGKAIEAQWQDAQAWMAGGQVPGRDVARPASVSPLPPFVSVMFDMEAKRGGRGEGQCRDRGYGSSRGRGRGRGRGQGRVKYSG